MNGLTVPEFAHRTVLLEEAVSALDLAGSRAEGVYVDGTFGRGGHSGRILECLGSRGRLIAFDKDPQAIAAAEVLAAKDTRFGIVHDSFATLDAALAGRGIGQVDGVLLDLGISSPQVDDAARGFSFRLDGPLDMRMDTTRGVSAARDGQIHTDSRTKIVTVLIYMNNAWEAPGGRLRLLRAPDNLEDVIAEVPPDEGTLLIFKNEPNAWHGFHAFEGPRRVIQLNWVSDQGVVRREQTRHKVSAFFKRLRGKGPGSPRM